MLHQKVLEDPVELSKLTSVKTKKKESKRRLSLPNAISKLEKMQKISPKRLNKTVGSKEDVFDFDESVSELEPFTATGRSYSAKRKSEAVEGFSE